MTTTSTRTLRPIIRDRAGAVGPIPAAIAAITGQPLTAVVRMLSQSIAAPKGMSGVHGGCRPRMPHMWRCIDSAISRTAWTPTRAGIRSWANSLRPTRARPVRANAS